MSEVWLWYVTGCAGRAWQVESDEGSEVESNQTLPTMLRALTDKGPKKSPHSSKMLLFFGKYQHKESFMTSV